MTTLNARVTDHLRTAILDGRIAIDTSEPPARQRGPTPSHVSCLFAAKPAGCRAASGRRSASALPVQHLHGLVQAPLAGFFCLGTFDVEHEPLLLAIREPREKLSRLLIFSQSRSQVIRDRDFTRRGIQLQVYVQLVAGLDARRARAPRR